MELNQLPEDYNEDELGPQKRQDEFASPEAKLAYDAENLIAKARESLQSPDQKTSQNTREQILERVEVIVSIHRKDYNGALIGAINAKLDNEESQSCLQQAQSREGSGSKYEAFVDDLKLSEIDTAKLKEMMSEVRFAEAIETAKEMKASRLPTLEQIVAELITYTPERLKDICAEMERPKLQIVSDQTFDGNIAAMDENKHYTSADGQSQEDAYVYRGSDSPYNKLAKPGKVKVSIVDGVARPKQLTGVSTKLGKRRDHLTAKFEDKKMSHIDQNEMATLIQQSLREAKAENANSLIVDNWEDGNGTITFINPDGLTRSPLVAYSLFDSRNRQANFNANYPHLGYGRARGRASVQVLEI